MSRGAFIPPMVCAWCMHGPFSAPSRYSSAFEFPASMIHHHATVPGTHSGPRARRPTAYPHVQAHSQRVAVAPYHHAPTVASLPRRSRATAYAHPHLHHTQPTATLHHCRRRSPLACHHHCRPAPSTRHHRRRLRAATAAVYAPPPAAAAAAGLLRCAASPCPAWFREPPPIADPQTPSACQPPRCIPPTLNVLPAHADALPTPSAHPHCRHPLHATATPLRATVPHAPPVASHTPRRRASPVTSHTPCPLRPTRPACRVPRAHTPWLSRPTRPAVAPRPSRPTRPLCMLRDDPLLDGIFRHLEPRQLIRLRLVCDGWI